MIEIDVEQMRVWSDGREVRLRPRQFQLLAALAAVQGRTVRRSRLLAEAWGRDFTGYDHALDQAVCQLRLAIGQRSLIETVPRCGYRLRPDLEVRVS